MISNWAYNLVGPPWFRRLRRAWRWYWSGYPMIELHDIEHMLNSERPLEWFRALVAFQHMFDKKPSSDAATGER